jgi:hypothetical protein
LCFEFYKIIVPRDIGQYPLGSRPYDPYADTYDLYGLRQVTILLKISFLVGCANSNRPVPDQHTSTVACWSVCVVGGQTGFLSSHKPQSSHVDFDHLD